jgi:hypothetical protein
VDIGLPVPGARDEYEEGMAVVAKMAAKNIPMVVVTAIQIVGFQRLAERHGIDKKKLEAIPVFSKPFFVEDVRDEVLKMVRKRRRAQSAK